MSDMHLMVGDLVFVRNTDSSGGEFYGRVTGFEMGGNVAVVTPYDEALRRWYPQGYGVGSAHWSTVLRRAED